MAQQEGAGRRRHLIRFQIADMIVKLNYPAAELRGIKMPCRHTRENEYQEIKQTGFPL
jgi:hypothetical protein